MMMAASACPASAATVVRTGATSASSHRAHAITKRDLLSAPVPSLRGNPAGHLKNGVLPHPSGGGSVGLVQSGPGAPAYGDVTGDKVRDAAAVIVATSGAGGGDEYVEVYTGFAHRLGQFNPAGAVTGLHAFVMAMTIRSKRVLIDFGVQMFSGTITYWSASLTWQNGRLH